MTLTVFWSRVTYLHGKCQIYPIKYPNTKRSHIHCDGNVPCQLCLKVWSKNILISKPETNTVTKSAGPKSGLQQWMLENVCTHAFVKVIWDWIARQSTRLKISAANGCRCWAVKTPEMCYLCSRFVKSEICKLKFQCRRWHCKLSAQRFFILRSNNYAAERATQVSLQFHWPYV